MVTKYDKINQEIRIAKLEGELSQARTAMATLLEEQTKLKDNVTKTLSTLVSHDNFETKVGEFIRKFLFHDRDPRDPRNNYYGRPYEMPPLLRSLACNLTCKVRSSNEPVLARYSDVEELQKCYAELKERIYKKKDK